MFDPSDELIKANGAITTTAAEQNDGDDQQARLQPTGVGMCEILIADDHPLYREAIVEVVKGLDEQARAYEADDFDTALAMVGEMDDLDLVLLDLNMPGMDGLNGLIQMRNAYPSIPVAMISAEQDREVVLLAITYGAVGYISKTAKREKIGDAIRQILSGQVFLPPDIIRAGAAGNKPTRETAPGIEPRLLGTLTKRQLLVLERLAKGDSNKQIAYHLNIAETTVKTHVSAILQKLKVYNRMQAVLCASKINFDQYLHR